MKFSGRRRTYGKKYRHPKTQSQRKINGRRNFLIYDDYKIKSRSKRNLANLANSWDDISRRDVDDKNWKRYRRFQYKIK
jgi:hypothetical protein